MKGFLSPEKDNASKCLRDGNGECFVFDSSLNYCVNDSVIQKCTGSLKETLLLYNNQASTLGNSFSSLFVVPRPGK